MIKCTHGKYSIDCGEDAPLITCVKCGQEWRYLYDFIAEIRQQSELKGFNEGIDKAVDVIRQEGNKDNWIFMTIEAHRRIKSVLENLKRSG